MALSPVVDQPIVNYGQAQFLAAHRVLDEGDGLSEAIFHPQSTWLVYVKCFTHTAPNELSEFILGVEYVRPHGPGWFELVAPRAECSIHLFGLNVLNFFGKEISVLCDEVIYLCIFELIDFPGSSTQVRSFGRLLHDYGDKLAPSSVGLFLQ